MPDVATPKTTRELLSALEQQRGDIAAGFRALPIEEYFVPQGAYWSPSEHLRHLVKSVRPVARALAIPKIALVVFFGLARRSRPFDEIVALYRAKITGGAGAGRYAPSPDRPGDDPEASRSQTLEHWNHAGKSLLDAAAAWSDSALDRFRLPHPLLGKLSVREMLYFTLYHNAHHMQRVRERRARAGSMEDSR